MSQEEYGSFVCVPSFVFHEPNMTLSALRIYEVLAEAGGMHLLTQMSLSDLSRTLNLSRGTIQRGLKILLDCGALGVEERCHDGETNTYVIHEVKP